MPYRALTHNRVKHPINDVNGNTFVAQSNAQASAINSQNGVSNSGSVISTKNALNINNKQPARKYARTLTPNFLMGVNAYGAGTQQIGGETFSTYAPGQGKGFPNATPQTSVGSTNAFARRAIARRAVTTVVNNGVKKNCACVPQSVKNLKGQFHN